MYFYNKEDEPLSLQQLRHEQVRIQNLIDKQESNGVYDDSLYDKLSRIEADITKIEKELSLEYE